MLSLCPAIRSRCCLLMVATVLSIALAAGDPASANATDTGRNAAIDRESGGRERATDRVVHIEEDLIREVPEVPRLCDATKSLVKRRVDVGGCELYCELAGQGVPLVLINGGPGGTHHGFHSHFSRAESFASVIYYDQRGCGLSDSEQGDGYSVDQAVDDLEHLREALEVDKWIVLGWSYGGIVAQCYAVTHPDHLAGLILVGSSTGMWVSLEAGREQMFISSEERKRIRDIRRAEGLSVAARIYNNYLNGDWKRQSYYKPSRERMAQIALYEWDPAPGFRAAMCPSADNVDLRGAFEDCPIPTLIIEGKWDLTWNTDKPGKLSKNHPGARLVMFDESAHSPFRDEPERFFELLRSFVVDLPAISPTELLSWKAHLARWKAERARSPEHILASIGWGGFRTSEEVAEVYSREWLEKLERFSSIRQTAWALYDLKRYDEALEVFKLAAENARAREDRYDLAVALIWQGHMLDLLGRRDQAISTYRRVVDLKERGGPERNDQYGLAFFPTSYALERTKVPFTRLENVWDELVGAD